MGRASDQLPCAAPLRHLGLEQVWAAGDVLDKGVAEDVIVSTCRRHQQKPGSASGVPSCELVPLRFNAVALSDGPERTDELGDSEERCSDASRGAETGEGQLVMHLVPALPWSVFWEG